MNAKELVAMVRLNLGNPSQQIVPDSEILKHLNTGQYTMVKEGAMIRTSSTTPTVINAERYPIPSDLISILRVDYDGNKIPLIEYDQIDNLDVS